MSTFFQSSSGAWTLHYADLSEYSGELVRVGFWHQGANAFSSGAKWYIDNIAISQNGQAEEISYVIEEPSCTGASGISNIRGLVWTTEPGEQMERQVTVIFDRGTDDESTIDVPCCSSRGDGAELLSGFSGVFNWCLLEPGLHTITLQFESTSGRSPTATREFISYCEHPQSSFLLEDEFDWAGSTDFCESAPPGVLVCETASNVCDGEIRYEWSQARQGLVLRSNCVDDGFDPPESPACSDEVVEDN